MEKENLQEVLSKYFSSETVTIKRSEIHPAEYNPRKISAEGKKLLKRSIKKYGVVGGIVVNKQTGNTIVGGHQKVFVLDEINNFPEKDYTLKVEMVDVDERTEKAMNVALNNSAIGGTFDYDMLAALVPDIDYKDAGLTEADLSMIGLDYLYKTEQQNNLANELEDMMMPVMEQRQAENEQRAQERAAIKAANQEAQMLAEREKAELSAQAENLAQQEMTREERVQHMKDVKAQVREQARENAQNMDAYLVLSFDTFKAKAEFCQRFGYQPMERMIKGEDFDSRCEAIMDDGEDYDEDID